MTAPHSLNPARLLDQALSDASPDLMRQLLSTVINALLSAEADTVCGAEYGQASPDRVTQRNGLNRPGFSGESGVLPRRLSGKGCWQRSSRSRTRWVEGRRSRSAGAAGCTS